MTKPPKTNKDYEHLGRMLTNIYESGYLDKNEVYKTSLIKGLIGGFAGVLGATILIGLLIWILTLFKQVPVVGPFVDKLRHTVQRDH